LTAPPDPPATIYEGTVVHLRLRPRQHRLSYRVFSLLVDVDRLAEASAQLRLFSYNAFNLFSVHDRDHGPGDGTPIAEHARHLLADAGIDCGRHGRIRMLAYPRLLGNVFNPLSVYYASDDEDRLTGVIYEVNNTFGERRSYVVPAGAAAGGVHAHGCAKQLYVSPFAPTAGRYGFRVTDPADNLLLGVHFHDAGGALIRTHFRAAAVGLSDKKLAGLMWRYPLQTGKVLGGIHYEALKLWVKGVPLVKRPAAPRYAVTNVPAEG
jgi:uncharacterized protein